MDFFQPGFKEPTQSNYMSFVDGENTFRVLGSGITGWEWWDDVIREDGTTGRKPIRVREDETINPYELPVDKNGEAVQVKYFWAFPVWNYADQRVQILEVKQKKVRASMTALVNNKKWGDPKTYDICVTKSGQGLETDYITSPEPKEPLDSKIVEKYEATKINLQALYDGADPFAGNAENVTPEEAEQIFNGDTKNAPITQ